MDGVHYVFEKNKKQYPASKFGPSLSTVSEIGDTFIVQLPLKRSRLFPGTIDNPPHVLCAFTVGDQIAYHV